MNINKKFTLKIDLVKVLLGIMIFVACYILCLVIYVNIRMDEEMKKESEYQSYLIKKIESQYPEILIMKNDSSYIQGIPDLTLLYENKWAMLEVKRSIASVLRPNQEFYIDRLKQMGGYASVIYPENEDEVINELCDFFKGGKVI